MSNNSILVIDNYDSFTWNLVHYLMELGAEVEVLRNDATSAGQALSSGAQAFLISPGPCTPNEAGISLELVAACAAAKKPLLGVCLGHQTIGQHFGGKVVRGGLMHGKTSPVSHDGSGLFAGLPSPFTATRYHSLIVEDIPADLIVNADVLTSLDPNAVNRTHAAHHPRATLVVRRDPDAATYGALGLDAAGRIRRFLGHGVADEPLEDVMFTGIHVLDPSVLAAIPADQFSPITDEYIAIVERDEPLRGHLSDATWIDIGTPERYQEAQRLVAAGAIPPWPSRLGSR